MRDEAGRTFGELHDEGSVPGGAQTTTRGVSRHGDVHQGTETPVHLQHDNPLGRVTCESVKSGMTFFLFSPNCIRILSNVI